MLRKLSLPLAVIVITLAGCLVASAIPAASDSLVTRTYDVHELINRALLYSEMPMPDLSQPQAESADLTLPATPEQLEDHLISRIRDTVEYSTWATVPPMKFEDENLIVVQTPHVQDMVARLVAKLNSGNHPLPAIRLDAEYFDVSSATHGNQTFLRATTNKKAGFLSADDANAIEDAAHNDPGIKISSATIQVEAFNAAGYSFTGRNLRYITGYDRVATGSTTTYQPKIANRGIGTLFSILVAIPSADGKYVTLDLRFQQNHLRGLKSLPSDQAPQLQIQMPMIDMTEVRTRVTLPQDGHLLLSGANGACFILLHASILPAKG